MDRNLADDFRWLLRQSAGKLIEDTIQALDGQESVLTLTKRVRKSVSATRAALILEQAQLRIRGRGKFACADRMFFTRRGLEQSSGSDLATYKARFFSGQNFVADICCGIGGDLLALADRPRKGLGEREFRTVGIDSDRVTSMFAARNLEVALETAIHADEPAARKQWVQQIEFEKTNLLEFDAIHLDPDRRMKRRTVRGDQFCPSLDSVYSQVSDRHAICTKVAPATPLGDYAPTQLNREWLGDRRECKQQLLWSGNWNAEVRNRFGQRTATMVDGDRVHSISFPESDVLDACPIASRPGNFLLEPHATVLAAGLTDALANQVNACRATKAIPYLFADHRIDHGLLAAFRILDVVPLKQKSVQAALKKHDAGELECKRRGIDKIVATRFAKMKGDGATPAVLILTCIGRDKKHVAILAHRCEAADEPKREA